LSGGRSAAHEEVPAGRQEEMHKRS
jgi:hypothetical protein